VFTARPASVEYLAKGLPSDGTMHVAAEETRLGEDVGPSWPQTVTRQGHILSNSGRLASVKRVARRCQPAFCCYLSGSKGHMRWVGRSLVDEGVTCRLAHLQDLSNHIPCVEGSCSKGLRHRSIQTIECVKVIVRGEEATAYNQLVCSLDETNGAGVPGQCGLFLRKRKSRTTPSIETREIAASLCAEDIRLLAFPLWGSRMANIRLAVLGVLTDRHIRNCGIGSKMVESAVMDVQELGSDNENASTR